MQTFETCKDTFTCLLPELTRMAKAAFRDLRPEARAEAVQNALALTWKSYYSLIEQGRADEPGIIKSVLWYSIKQTRTGRTLPGTGEAEKPRDVYRNARKGRVRFEHVDLRHFVGDDTPVPDAVSFRLDVPAFFATLSDRQQRMAEDLMMGERTSTVAANYGVTPGAVSQFRLRFKELFEAYMAG
jgi:hypothetical protein